MPLVLERNGYSELCHFTFSYSPIRNIQGQIDGMFTAAVETSERVKVERRQAFQLALADELRGLSATDDIIATATGLLRKHLQVARVYYSEIDDRTATFNIPLQWTESADLPQLPARGSVAEFGPYLLMTLRQGQPVVVDDMRTDPNFTAFVEPYESLAIRSIVIVPLIREGQLRGNLNVAHIAARSWTAEDLLVIADVAERTWDALERARAEEALRASEERYRTLFESIDEGFCIIEFIDGPHGPMSDYVHLEANPAYERHAGIVDIVGKTGRDDLTESEANAWVEIFRRVVDTGEAVRFKRALESTDRYLEVVCSRVEPASRRQVAIVFQDITARYRAERALQELNENLEDVVAERTRERDRMWDTTQDLMLLIDFDGYFRRVNPA